MNISSKKRKTVPPSWVEAGQQAEKQNGSRAEPGDRVDGQAEIGSAQIIAWTRPDQDNIFNQILSKTR